MTGRSTTSTVETARLPGSLSVIIPALDEAAWIAASVESARRDPGAEVLVVDGGSSDATADVARSAGATVLAGPRGRAAQMNTGARAARGETLLFLHADTRLAGGYGPVIHATLARQDTALGAFRLSIDGPGPGLRFVNAAANLRARWLSLPYGDQGLFLRATTLAELGGFPEIPILEDYVLVRAARRSGRVRIAPLTVATSSRRWLQSGVLRTTLRHQMVLLGYHLGVDTGRLARWRAPVHLTGRVTDPS